jgi:NAD(P)-dependent dehydrogenase (short-subunit alcohol dehydrogenase family)
LLREFDLNGKVALITGNSGHLTKAFVEALARNGADFAAVLKSISDMDEVMSEMEQLGRRGMLLKTDVTKPDNIQSTVETIRSRFGKIDILINNACLEYAKPLMQCTESDWKNVISDNLSTVILWCHTVGRHMLERKAGKIINIISGLAVRSMPNYTVYCATMGAIHQFTKALALEWAPYAITVNAIAQGWISGEKKHEEKITGSLARHVPMGRVGKPSDITGPLVYLASEASDYMTGETVFVDGGLISRG